MKYTRIVRNKREDWITVGQYIKDSQLYIYNKLKLKYPVVSRIITDEREFNDIKGLMEERQGVII